MSSLHLLRCLVAVVTVVGVTACGEEDPATRAASERVIVALEASPVPPTLNGLKVAEEDIADVLEGADRPYLEAATLYSLREGEALQATLQVGRFAADAKFADPDFRSSLVNRIGNGGANDFRMGDDTVWLTAGDRQSIAVWFNEDHIFVLSAREEYPGARALLREALGIEP